MLFLYRQTNRYTSKIECERTEKSHIYVKDPHQ